VFEYWHLLITPFHGGLQKVKGNVDGFTELYERLWSMNALMRIGSQGGKLSVSS